MRASYDALTHCRQMRVIPPCTPCSPEPPEIIARLTSANSIAPIKIDLIIDGQGRDKGTPEHGIALCAERLSAAVLKLLSAI